MTSAAEMNHNTAHPILPMGLPAEALSITPQTTNEVLLLAALHEAIAWEESLKLRLIELQATNILNEA